MTVAQFDKSPNIVSIDDTLTDPMYFRHILVVDGLFQDVSFYTYIKQMADDPNFQKFAAHVPEKEGVQGAVELEKIYIAYEERFAAVNDELAKRVAVAYNLYKDSLPYPLMRTGLPATMDDCMVEVSTLKVYRGGTDDNIGPHVDCYMRGWDDTDIMVARPDRFMNVIFYCNDVTKGGKTEFYFDDCTVSVTPKKGRIVIFPPMWTHPHAALPTESEDKYIVNCHIRYALTEAMMNAQPESAC